MSLDKKPEKYAKKGAIGRKRKIPITEGTAGPELVAKIADTSISLGEVVQRLKKEHDINVTIPTVTTYLQMQWGKEYADKKKAMSLRRSKVKRWKTEYGLARQGIASEFYEDYISTDDGVFYQWGDMDNIFSKNELESLPRIEDRAYKGKDIINYSKEAKFGWKPDPKDPDALGTANHAALSIMTLQLRRRIEGLVEEKKRKLVQEETRKRVEDYAYEHRESLTAEDIPKLMRDMAKDVRQELKPELIAMDAEVEERLLEVLAKLSKGDARTRILHGKEIYNKKLDPAYASSDKKWRGRQRMVALPDKIFSRSVYNLPFMLWMHPKRLQVHSHNLSKKLPELLKPEEPVVKAEYNDIPGVNGRVRFPKNVEEHVKTQEAGMIVTEDFAKKFKYFTVVEEGTLIADGKTGFPTAPRINTRIENYKGYKKETDIIKGTYPVDRLDPLTLGGFDELGVGVGNKFAKHSGELFLVGDSKERKRKITLAQGESGDETREVTYYSQDYQIVREDELRIGDKILDRGGLKGIISDIVPSLGVDPKTYKPYDLVCNYEEVWRESPDKLMDDTYLKQGKKKSAIVREHEEGKGQIFFYMIDKFAQDSTTTGLSFSPTLVSGLWEWALDGLEMNTEEARNNLIDAFASSYFRGRGNLVPTLKALHYKAVKKNGVVTLEIDDKEATADENGEIIDLPHTYAGNTYQKAYVPHSVARVYFDGKSTINTTVIPVKIEGIFQLMTIEDIFELYSGDIIKNGDIESIDLSAHDIKILSHNYDIGKSGFYHPQYIMRHYVEEDLCVVKDSDAGIPIVTKDHSLMVGGRPIKPLDLKESFDLDVVEKYPIAGSSGITYSNGDGLRITEIDIINLLTEPKRNVEISVDDNYIEYIFKYTNTDEKRGWVAGEPWKEIIYPRKIKTDEDFGFLCGLYLAEGCAGGSFLYTGTDWKLAEKVRKRAEKIFGENNIMTQSKKVEATDNYGEHMDYTVRFSNQQGIGIFESLFGHDAKHKQLPDDILIYSTKFIKGLLRGYFLGDGNLDGFDWYLRSGGFATKSRKLVSQIVFILKYKFGAENFRFKYTEDGAYVVFWNKDKDKSNAHKMKDSLITIPYKGYVYDFEVTKTGNFVDALGGIILHNTFREVYISQLDKTPNDASDFYWFNIMKQAKNRFGLFPKMDWGIQLVTRPWAEDSKDPTKYHKVQMDYLDVIDMGGDPYDPNLIVTFRKEPVTGKESIQTHSVQVDFTGKTRGTMGMNPTVALEATIDYDGDTVVAFVPPIKDAIVELPKEKIDELKEWKTKKFDESFDALYKKARNLKMAESEEELGVMCAAYNQQIAETENELIERLGGLRKRSMILQGKYAPPVVTIGEGTKYEETHTMDIALINQISDVEKVLKMKEPRWKVKKLEKRPINDLTKEEWELVRDSYLRKELTKLVNEAIKDKGVKKLYDLLREPSDYMKKEFVTKSGYEGDPIGLKIDTKSRLLDRILFNELRESDIFEDLDER